MTSYKFGIIAEKIVIFFLRFKGYKILEWRYKTSLGEIDIIAKKSNLIIFIEVKSRKKKTNLEEILHPKQIFRIKQASQIFIAKNNHLQKYDLRFDFIEVDRFYRFKHYCNFIC